MVPNLEKKWEGIHTQIWTNFSDRTLICIANGQWLTSILLLECYQVTVEQKTPWCTMKTFMHISSWFKKIYLVISFICTASGQWLSSILFLELCDIINEPLSKKHCCIPWGIICLFLHDLNENFFCWLYLFACVWSNGTIPSIHLITGGNLTKGDEYFIIVVMWA